MTLILVNSGTVKLLQDRKKTAHPVDRERSGYETIESLMRGGKASSKVTLCSRVHCVTYRFEVSMVTKYSQSDVTRPVQTLSRALKISGTLQLSSVNIPNSILGMKIVFLEDRDEVSKTEMNNRGLQFQRRDNSGW